MGRPSKYTDKIAERICSGIAQGKSLVFVLKPNGMPDYSTVTRWLRDERYEDFRKMYARAREDQADYLADEILDISDEKAMTSEAVQRNRLRVDSRKWAAAKLRPRKYSDRVDLAHQNPDGTKLEPLIIGIPPRNTGGSET